MYVNVKKFKLLYHFSISWVKNDLMDYYSLQSLKIEGCMFSRVPHENMFGT